MPNLKHLAFLLTLGLAFVNYATAQVDPPNDEVLNRRLAEIKKKTRTGPAFKNKRAAGRNADINRAAKRAESTIKRYTRSRTYGLTFKNSRRMAEGRAQRSLPPGRRLMGPRYKNIGAKSGRRRVGKFRS